MTPTLELDAFSGEAKGAEAVARGLANLGESAPKVAAVMADARQRKQAFQDDVSLAQYDRRMGEAYARYKESLPGRPEGDYLAGWQAAQAKEREAVLKDLTVSERGRAGLARYDADFSRRTAVDLVGLASHTMVRRGTDEILAQAERLFASGEDDAAYALCDGLERQGAFTTDQKMAQFAKWNETRRTEFLGARMTHQPREFMQNLGEYIATGHSKDLLESVRDRDEAQGWLQKTRQHFRGVQSTTRREVFGAIGEEKLTRESEVDGGGNLDEEDLVAARKGLAIQHTPVDFPIYGRLRLAALAYDAAADTDGSGLAALDREIVAGVPGPQAARLLQQAREPDSPARRRQAALFRKVESHATSGHLGETGRDAEGTIVDAPKARNVAMKAEALRLDLEHFLQKNPDAPATKVDQFLEDQLIVGGLRSSVSNRYQNLRSGGNNR